MFVVASLVLLPVILSSIKCCESQHGDSISSTDQRSKMVCLWVIIRLPNLRIKPRIVWHHARDQIVPAHLPAFCTVCSKKLGRSLGTRLCRLHSTRDVGENSIRVHIHIMYVSPAAPKREQDSLQEWAHYGYH